MARKKLEGEGRTIQFDPDVFRIVEDYRRRQEKIPSFSKAVNEIIRGRRSVEEEEDRDILQPGQI